MASRQLLQSGVFSRAAARTSCHFSPSTRPQSRAISTTSFRFAPPPRDGQNRTAGLPPRPTWSSRNRTATANPPPPPPSSAAPKGFSPSTAASKSAASDHVYDATSDTFDLSKIIQSESDEFLNKHRSAREPELWTKPVLGRTVPVNNRVDLAGAVQRVGAIVRANKIKKLARLQRFHERPGLKRKRLRSERWRDRFKFGFVETVKRVQEMKNQGW